MSHRLIGSSASIPCSVKIKIQVTKQDISEAKGSRLNDPLMHALERATGSPWRMSEVIGMVLELAEPNRLIRLQPDVLEQWRTYRSDGMCQPFKFEAELIDGHES
jgi:hypothetical protein